MANRFAVGPAEGGVPACTIVLIQAWFSSIGWGLSWCRAIEDSPRDAAWLDLVEKARLLATRHAETRVRRH